MSRMYSLSEVCAARAGLRAIVFSDMTNVLGYGPGDLPPGSGTAPSFTDTDQLYSIAMERYTGEASRESGSDDGGDYATGQIRCFVPLSRSEVDILLRRWRNRLLLVIGIDRYGTQHVLADAIASWRHTTGARPGTRHGYEITFSAPLHYIRQPIAGDGEIATAPPVGGGGGSDPGSGDCCITIQPIQIAYTPAPTGNVSNLNEIVTTQNGSVYFIDATGRAIILNRPAPRYYFFDGDGVDVDEITLPLGFPVPDPDDYPLPTYSEQDEMSIRLRVKLGSRWIQYGHEEGFTVDYASRKVLIPTGTRGANAEIYSYEGIPARPL